MIKGVPLYNDYKMKINEKYTYANPTGNKKTKDNKKRKTS